MTREWLVFFGDTRATAWWAWFLRPGFRHIAAASYYASTERWVYFDPSVRGTVIEVLTREQFPVLLDELLVQSSAVLRFASRHERTAAPAMVFCVAEIKALLGIRSAALSPWRLYWALRRRGAEVVVGNIENQPVAARIGDVGGGKLTLE